MRVAVLFAILAATAHAQDVQSNLTFEVAVVKPGDPNASVSSTNPRTPDRFLATNATLEMLIRYAYSVPRGRDRLVGPDWVTKETFTIAAKAERATTDAEKRGMVRALLEDRFKLRLRQEERQGRIYAIVLPSGGNLGPNLHPSLPACVHAAEERVQRADPGSTVPPNCRVENIFPNVRGSIAYGAVTMATLASLLSDMFAEHFVDQTGLPGRFDMLFTADARAMVPLQSPTTNQGDASSAASRPSIFTALREDLGLKLEAQRGPVPYWVVDRAERPTFD